MPTLTPGIPAPGSHNDQVVVPVSMHPLLVRLELAAGKLVGR
jgi:hypothetical protein